jgi:RimJ/RimL family protein N-acetyltransferase
MTSQVVLRRGPVALHPAGDVESGPQGSEWVVEVNGIGGVGRLRGWVKSPAARRGGVEVRFWLDGADGHLPLALRQLVDHMIWAHELHKVELEELDYRGDVLTAALRCGFVEEGRRRHTAIVDSSWRDTVALGMVEDQWMRGMPRQPGTFVPGAPTPVEGGPPSIPSPTGRDFAVLQGKRVTLRRKGPSDKELFFRWLCRTEWWRGWMPGDPDGFRAPARQEFEANWSAEAASNDWVVETEKGVPIGRCFYDALDIANRSAVAGVLLYESESWGKGYGTDAFGVLVRHLFEGLHLHRVGAATWSGNIGSLRVLEKNGLVVEARYKDCYRVDDRWHDGIGAGMLEHEYAAVVQAK